MPKATLNWDSTDTWKRLMASVVATGVKLDLKEMAKCYGTTYDTLQNRFRQINKDAAALKEAVKDGTASPAAAKSTASTPESKSPKKKDALHAVANGRVAKTPTKKKGVKAEPEDDDEELADFGHNDDGETA